MELDSLFSKYSIVKDESATEENVTVFRCILQPDNASEFVKMYSAATHTNWILYQSRSPPLRSLYRRKWKCHLSSVKKTRDSNRNFGCQAFIDIRIKKVTRNTKMTDAFLKLQPPLSAIIKMNMNHSHPTNISLGLLRAKDQVKQEFIAYFMSGLTPTESYHLYQSTLFYREANYETFSNSSINPTKNMVNYFYKCWKDNQGPTTDPFEKLKKKSKLYEKNGTSVITSVDYPWTVLIVTPLMKRAQNLPSAKEVIFVDSTFSLDNTGATVTAMLTTTKVGAVPIAVFIQENQTKESYKKAFKLLRNNFPFSFGKEQAPLIFMSDDSEARKSAFTDIWPATQQLLCRFHVVQALWRFLWSTKIPKENIPYLNRLFHNVMYSNTEESLAKSVQDVLELENSFPEFVKHFKVFYRRKEEWVSYYCMETLASNNDTIDYSEASIRVLKDIILTRTKVLNILTLTEFCISVLDPYLFRELLNHAYNRPHRAALLYSSLSKKASKHLEIQACSNKEILLVQSVNFPNYFYTVNVNVGICSCANGKTGAFCKHQLLLHVKEKINLPNVPTASLVDQHTLALLALGSKCPPLSIFQFVQSAIVESINNIPIVQSLNADYDQQHSPPVDDNCSNNMEPATDIVNDELGPLSFSPSVPNVNMENISNDAVMQFLNADYDQQHLQTSKDYCSNILDLDTNSTPLSLLQSMDYTIVENVSNEAVMQSLNADYYQLHPQDVEESCNDNMELATDSDKDECISEILRVIRSKRVSRPIIKTLAQILRKI